MSNHKPNYIMRFLLGLVILSLSCSLPAVAVTPQPVTQPVTQTLSFTPIMPPEIPPTSTPIAPPAAQPSSTPIAPPAIPPTRTLDLTPIAPPQIIPQLIPTYLTYQIIPQNNPASLATQQIFSINSQAITKTMKTKLSQRHSITIIRFRTRPNAMQLIQMKQVPNAVFIEMT